MAEIIPRWEWRSFGTMVFGESEKLVREHGQVHVRRSGEVHVLSQRAMNSTEVRDNLVDIKTLKAVNEDGLGRWNPILETALPLGPDVLAQSFAAFGVPLPALARPVYSLAQCLKERIRPQPELRAVRAAQERHGFLIEGCIVEIAEVTFDGRPFRTTAVEQEDPRLVIETVRVLRRDGYENVNCLRTMMSAVGMA